MKFFDNNGENLLLYSLAGGHKNLGTFSTDRNCAFTN